ncbi:DNA-binding response regulator [Oleomonas cavernae]|uniref:DNA-binding response regulator n=1 Tax=Oleomonas cavernae TaxID=2320859 RepID=A0A418WTG0_9PROT|nr:response regulator transcription factor [Oleomonas cavernae]RJF94553.1 DNA-binding response regulator [Oleomonas cavernae]
MRVLLVEDDSELGPVVADNLRRDGFTVDLAPSLADAVDLARLGRFDIAVLDRRLPDGDGLSLVPVLHRLQPGLPILALTARDASGDRVDGLNAGADDYMGKPFVQAELVARLRALLRRPRDLAATVVSSGNLAFDTTSHELLVDGRPLALSRRELALAELLLRRAGRVVQKANALDALYGLDEAVEPNALEAVVSRLRRRLAEAQATVEITTVRGVGYVLDGVT